MCIAKRLKGLFLVFNHALHSTIFGCNGTVVISLEVFFGHAHLMTASIPHVEMSKRTIATFQIPELP